MGLPNDPIAYLLLVSRVGAIPALSLSKKTSCVFLVSIDRRKSSLEQPNFWLGAPRSGMKLSNRGVSSYSVAFRSIVLQLLTTTCSTNEVKQDD